MRIEAIELSGFRGVLEPLSLSLSGSFIVVSGPNGSGKSTICDGIEYALTGTISKYANATEGGERLEDYVWWRGRAARKSERYVKLRLAREDGSSMEVIRTPQGLLRPSQQELESAVCDLVTAPSSPLAEMCRTTIIRDEWIAGSSVDLPETDRFGLVRAAVGSPEFSHAEGKLTEVSERIKSRLQTAQKQYEAITGEVQNIVKNLTEARAHAVSSDSIASALSALQDLVGTDSQELAPLLSHSEAEIGRLRRALDDLTQVAGRIRRLREIDRSLREEGVQDRLERVNQQLSELRRQATGLQTEVDGAERQLSDAKQATAVSTSLAQLYEHGTHVGLQEGRCPLCGTLLEDAAFRAALEDLRRRVDDSAARAAENSRRHSELIAQRQDLIQRMQQLEAESRRLLNTLNESQEARTTLIGDFSRLAIPVIDSSDVDSLESAVGEVSARARERLSALQANRQVLTASLASSKIVDLEREHASASDRVQRAEAEVIRLRRAVERAKEAIGTVKRVAAETVDTRLMAISPLLSELYGRLKPHSDWTEVGYHIRGDVRRFLSLRVGEELNLRFMFSSGQRRAAGLAFLLAVSLSRGWCQLKTLVLDDPVQHVDDFRALHLVETLGAIQQRGWQVLCCVEDPQLAKLLLRRLRSREGDEGVHIRMRYLPGRGVGRETEARVRPFPTRVLHIA